MKNKERVNEPETTGERKPKTDAELVTSFQQGNIAGFNELVRRYQEKVYWIARRIVLDHDDADDITQEVFVKVYAALAKFRQDSEFYTWLYRIATNLSLNYVRAKKGKQGISLDDDFEVRGEQASHPDSILEGKELTSIIEKAVETLPKQQRAVFVLRYYDELSYEEISEILKLSVGGLKANYFHALKKIQKFLEHAM